MCGIAGIYSLDEKPIPNAEARVARMIRLMLHRGPDGNGVYASQDRRVSLGNARLAIVDPKIPINGPFQTHDGRGVLTFNGEIYNYLELRDELEKAGVPLRTHTDTEVLAEGLRREGESFVRKLDGMWAFAYYDMQEKTLLLSRDLMGERHLFYAIRGNEFIFASEPAPLCADSKEELSIDFDGFVTSMLYFSPPPGRTMIQGISRLRSGHHMLARPRSQPIEKRFLKLNPSPWLADFRKDPSIEHGMEAFEHVYQKACKRRIPREVPYISTLSGGIDSTLTCIYISEAGKDRVSTLYGQSTKNPPQKKPTDLDELTASRFTADFLKTDHNEIILNSDEAVPVLRTLSENAFDGMYDSGVASFEMLARFAKLKKNKVMLIADGPDEMLGGYLIDQKAYQWDRFQSRHSAIFRGLHLISRLKTIRKPMVRYGLGELLPSPLIRTDPFRFIPVHSSWDSSEVSQMLSWNQVEENSRHYGILDTEYADLYSEVDDPQKRALSYATYTLPDMFNLRVDKAYLRESVEARLPYQAPEMIELMIAMPTQFRFGDGSETKAIMRKLVNRYLGPKLAYRSKHGFSAAIWKSRNVFNAMGYREAIEKSPIFDIFPFHKNARRFVLDSKNEDFLWPFFVLARTHDCLVRREFGKT